MAPTLAVCDMPTPVGMLFLVVGPRGLVKVAFDDEDRGQVISRLERNPAFEGCDIIESASATASVRHQLQEYFESRRRRFDMPIDPSLAGEFVRKVMEETSRIPYGQVATYGEVAEAIGHPRAARAVGNALASNPLPIVTPCHRVVRSGGAVGGYGGRPDRKKLLLELETHADNL